ncbi:MAG: hypothetical protein KAU94_12695 [Verrucomicrobia bacterium]|nr:hypothetical protein [Verrucomicrobiota bacterium]
MKKYVRSSIALALAVGAFIATNSYAALSVTNGGFGTVNRNGGIVDGGGWFESGTANWVEGTWTSASTPNPDDGGDTFLLLMDGGSAAMGYIYQSLGTITAEEIALGSLPVTADFAEKNDGSSNDVTFDFYVGAFPGAATGVDIDANLTSFTNITLGAVAQGLTPEAGDTSRTNQVAIGSIDVSGLIVDDEVWLRIAESRDPAFTSGDLMLDNLFIGEYVEPPFEPATNNLSFENPDVDPGAYSNGSPPEWTFSGGGVEHVNDDRFGGNNPLPAPGDGDQVAYINLGFGTNNTAWATSGAITQLVERASYTLTVAIGERADGDKSPNGSIGLWVGGNPVGTFTSYDGTSLADGTFTDMVYTYTAPGAGDPLIGQDVQVRMEFSSINDTNAHQQAQFDNVRLEIVGAEAIPATIISFTQEGDNMRMVIDAPSAANKYYPKATANLVIPDWDGVPHSDDGVNPFVTTNLSYSTADGTGTNEVIYVQADDAAKFFGIGGE